MRKVNFKKVVALTLLSGCINFSCLKASEYRVEAPNSKTGRNVVLAQRAAALQKKIPTNLTLLASSLLIPPAIVGYSANRYFKDDNSSNNSMEILQNQPVSFVNDVVDESSRKDVIQDGSMPINIESSNSDELFCSLKDTIILEGAEIPVTVENYEINKFVNKSNDKSFSETENNETHEISDTISTTDLDNSSDLISEEERQKIIRNAVESYCAICGYSNERKASILSASLAAIPGFLKNNEKCSSYEKIAKRVVYLVDLSLGCCTVGEFEKKIKELPHTIDPSYPQICFDHSNNILNEDFYFWNNAFSPAVRGNKNLFDEIDPDACTNPRFFYENDKFGKRVYYKAANGEILDCDYKPYLYKNFSNVSFKYSCNNESYNIYFTGDDCVVYFDIRENGNWKFGVGL